MSEENALEAFIAARLPLMPVPVLPHILLHQATPGSGLAQLDGALGADEDAAPYWAHRWGGGLALAQWITAFPQEVTECRVLDLGCGSGIVGIAAGLAGAAEICAVDCDPRAVVATRMNALANHVPVQAICTDPLDGPLPDVDLLLVGDLFYDAALAQRTAGFLERCHQAGVAIIVGDPFRAPLPLDRLEPIARFPAAEYAGQNPVPVGGVFRWRG